MKGGATDANQPPLRIEIICIKTKKPSKSKKILHLMDKMIVYRQR